MATVFIYHTNNTTTKKEEEKAWLGCGPNNLLSLLLFSLTP
jgi:hypothetical protein